MQASKELVGALMGLDMVLSSLCCVYVLCARSECARVLLCHGADAWACDANGVSCVAIAARRGGTHVEAVIQVHTATHTSETSDHRCPCLCS